MTKEDLHKIIESHRKWLDNEEGGNRANLHGADLLGAEMGDADLRVKKRILRFRKKGSMSNQTLNKRPSRTRFAQCVRAIAAYCKANDPYFDETIKIKALDIMSKSDSMTADEALRSATLLIKYGPEEDAGRVLIVLVDVFNILGLQQLV